MLELESFGLTSMQELPGLFEQGPSRSRTETDRIEEMTAHMFQIASSSDSLSLHLFVLLADRTIQRSIFPVNLHSKT